MSSLRRQLLSGARGDVLEIGAGTGLNLQHYGTGVATISLVEPDAVLHPRLRRRLEASGLTGRIVGAGAEALPFPDDHFDAAVSTLVLCSVPDPVAALTEIARVLRPGGRFLFIEHVRGVDGSRLERWQARLHGAWHALACGCNTDRDTRRMLDDSSLQIVDIAESSWRGMPPIVRPLIVGAAVLPE